jgi:cell division protein ZipA
MDILVVLGIMVAVVLILIGLFMVFQPKYSTRKTTQIQVEPISVASRHVESLAESVKDADHIAPVISANDFITQTIHQHNHESTRIHPTLDSEHLDDQKYIKSAYHSDLEKTHLMHESVSELNSSIELPLLIDSESTPLSVDSEMFEEHDHNGLDAMLNDLAQATSIEEMSRHEDIISDLNQVYDSLMPRSAPDSVGSAPVIDTRQVPEWEGESALINEHLAEHTRSEEDSILVQAEQIIAIHLLPKSGRALEGRTVLRLLRKYGLRFGEMDLFHRFEETTGEGTMMFSVLKYTQEGPAGFDLDTMEQDSFEGLSFFLALPGIKPLQGFDMMMSTAQRLGQECYAQLLDDQMNSLSEQLKGHYRHQVLDFRPAR